MIIAGLDYELIEHSDYKYKTIRNVVGYCGLLGHHIKTKYFELAYDGRIVIYNDYAWDGCSGVPDLKSTILPSLWHDVGYQCLREELILLWSKYGGNIEAYIKAWESMRLVIDKLFKWAMGQDGAWRITQYLYYHGVRTLGGKYAKPERLK